MKNFVKRWGMVLSILSMMAMLLVACGAKETTTEEVQTTTEDAVQEVQTDEAETDVEEPSEEFTFPDMGYNEWLTDEEGNNLWGYQTPLGFVINEEFSNDHRVVYYRGGEKQFEEEFEICCINDEEGKWQKWYEDGEVNADAVDTENITVIENGTIDTPYGVFKDYILDDNRENYADNEMAFLYLPTGRCIKIEIGLSGWAYEGSMTHLLNVLTGEKQEKIEISDSYENCLYAETGEKILGFHTPEGYKISDDGRDDSISLDGGTTSISIYEFNLVTKVYEDGEEQIVVSYQSNGDPNYTHFNYKEEVDSSYGTIKFYETKTDSFDITAEEAILRINGRYIVLHYFDLDSDEYTGKLKELVETQLFE